MIPTKISNERGIQIIHIRIFGPTCSSRDAYYFCHVSFMVGYLPEYIPFCGCLRAFDVSMVEHFLTLESFFQEKQNYFGQFQPAVSCRYLLFLI